MATPIFGLNIVNPQSHSTLSQKPARVAFLSLAGDQGCEESILGLDDRLLDMLGLIELVSWPLLDGLDVPDEFDIAVIEGAVCTRAQAERLLAARASASVIIAIGACALTGGIPALSSTNASLESDAVLSPESVSSLPEFFTARSVSSFISVDYTVPGCPVNATEFVSVLQRALRGMRPDREAPTMCGSCRLNERGCLLDSGIPCLGMVTSDGCGAVCCEAGTACVGCRGVSPSANLVSARECVVSYTGDGCAFDELLRIFNSPSLVSREDVR